VVVPDEESGGLVDDSFVLSCWMLDFDDDDVDDDDDDDDNDRMNFFSGIDFDFVCLQLVCFCTVAGLCLCCSLGWAFGLRW